MFVQTVGVVGAGVMGVGVAQSLAQVGYRVLLLDVSETILERARKQIKDGLRLHRMLNHSADVSPLSEIQKRISYVTVYDSFTDVDFVVENVIEKWDIKRAVFQSLDAICPGHTIFAANTSTISITRLGSVTQRASQVLGMHFMNPVTMKNTVEVIRGYHTSEATLELARSLLARMGKEGIVVQDMPGFVSNRVLMLTINEAIWLLQDQVASAQEIDSIFTSCFGHAMGPLETADLIGLDTILYSIESLYESFRDSKYRPCPLLVKLVAAGLHGRKVGQGFYQY